MDANQIKTKICTPIANSNPHKIQPEIFLNLQRQQLFHIAMLHIPRLHSEPCQGRDTDEIRYSDRAMMDRSIQPGHLYYSAKEPPKEALNPSPDGTSSIGYCTGCKSEPLAASHTVPLRDAYTSISSPFENLGLEDFITPTGETRRTSQRIKRPLWKKVLKAPYKGAKYVVKKWRNPSPECMRCVQMTSWIVVIVSAIIGTVITLIKIC
jgi:hypothetical protein